MIWLRFASFWVYPSLATLLLILSWRQSKDWTAPELAGLMFAGLLLWTLLEYCLHRFLFHWVPRDRRMRRFLATLHLRHHGDPRDQDGILVRTRYSLPVSALVWLGLWLACGNVVPAVWLLMGVWAGFLYYELVHYRIHLSKRGGGLLAIQRRAHFYHHFVDDGYCFGVTSPIWDWILGTHRRVDTK